MITITLTHEKYSMLEEAIKSHILNMQDEEFKKKSSEYLQLLGEVALSVDGEIAKRINDK